MDRAHQTRMTSQLKLPAPVLHIIHPANKQANHATAEELRKFQMIKLYTA